MVKNTPSHHTELNHPISNIFVESTSSIDIAFYCSYFEFHLRHTNNDKKIIQQNLLLHV